jgi:sarcosine oxidase, subunit gamma
MSEALRRESPLVGQLSAGLPVRHAVPGIEMQELAFLGHVNLRCDAGDASLAAAFEGVLGCALPRTPNTFNPARGAGKVLWLGPDEYLVMTPDGQEAALAQALRQAAGEACAAVVELGCGQTVIELAGQRAREVLAKGCPLDLHPRAFGPGRCAQSRLARSLVTIAQTDATPRFELIVRRSFADYLWQWLVDASACAVTPAYV